MRKLSLLLVCLCLWATTGWAQPLNAYGSHTNLDETYLRTQIRADFHAARPNEVLDAEGENYWLTKARTPDLYSDRKWRVGWNKYYAARLIPGNEASADPRLAGEEGVIPWNGDGPPQPDPNWHPSPVPVPTPTPQPLPVPQPQPVPVPTDLGLVYLRLDSVDIQLRNILTQQAATTEMLVQHVNETSDVMKVLKNRYVQLIGGIIGGFATAHQVQ